MGCVFFTFIGIVVLVGWAISGLFGGFDVAKEPPPKPTNPVLVDATFYITGADGGPYEVKWFVIKPNGDYLRKEHDLIGYIKDKPIAYPINLDGLDRHADHFLVPTIEIRARKVEAWQGTLQVFLKVNGEIVDCNSTSEPRPGRWDVATVEFNDDEKDSYEGDNYCKFEWWTAN